jgi:SAM-dependent methyltransferase
VVGIDCCAPFLDVARADAQAAGASNVRFVLGDAQTESFPADFDLCFARFGTMFFDDPVAAMGNLRRAMRSGGRLLMLVWRRLEDNEGVATAKAVVRRHLPPAPGEAASGGPGPYSMADPDEVRALLEAAGWTGAAFEPIDAAISIGATLDEAVAYSLTFGPAGEILRKAGEVGEAKRPLIAADLRAAFAPRLADGGVMVGSSSWCVTAAAG